MEVPLTALAGEREFVVKRNLSPIVAAVQQKPVIFRDEHLTGLWREERALKGVAWPNP
jgi:hypothetical protein